MFDVESTATPWERFLEYLTVFHPGNLEIPPSHDFLPRPGRPAQLVGEKPGTPVLNAVVVRFGDARTSRIAKLNQALGPDGESKKRVVSSKRYDLGLAHFAYCSLYKVARG